MRGAKLLKIAFGIGAASILALTAAPIVYRQETGSDDARELIGGVLRSLDNSNENAKVVTEASDTMKNNIPYRKCEWDASVKSKEFNAATPEAYARRMIYSYAQMSRVLSLNDCTCHGKVAPYTEVQNIEAWLNNTLGPDWKRITVGQLYFNTSAKLRKRATALCGEDF